MKTIVFTFQNIPKSLPHYRQLQWTSIVFEVFKFEVSNEKKRNVTAQYSVEEATYREQLFFFYRHCTFKKN